MKSELYSEPGIASEEIPTHSVIWIVSCHRFTSITFKPVACKLASRLKHQAGMFSHLMEANAGPVFFGYADFGGK